MGLSKYLQSYVGRLLRPYLLHDVSPLVELKLSGIHFTFPPLHFDVAFLNSNLVSSTMLAFQHLRLEGLKISLLPFTTPAFTLELGGIYVTMRLRSSEDEFWIERKRYLAEHIKQDTILAIDPEGTAIHLEAQMLLKEEVSPGFWKNFFMVLALRTVNIQIQAAIIEFMSNSQGAQVDSCCITFRNVELEAGISEERDITGGLMGASLAAIWNVLRMPVEPFVKVCKAGGLALQLEHKIPSRQIIPPVAKAGSCFMTSENMVLAVKLHYTQLDTIHLDVPETTLRVGPQHLENLCCFVCEIQTIGTVEPVVVQDASKAKNKVQENSARSSKDLWQSALEQIISITYRKRLIQGLQARVLQHRYVHLYASWLQEIGWCPNSAQIDSWKTCKRPSNSQRQQQIRNELLVMEQDLPAEAIALARRIARRRVSTIQAKHVSFWKIDMRVYRRCLCVLRSLFSVLLKARWWVASTFSGLYQVYCTIKLKLSCLVTMFIENNGSGKIDDVPRRVSFHGKQPIFILPKVPQWRKSRDTKTNLSRSVKVRTGDLRGNKREQAVSFTMILWKGCISVTGSPDIGISQSILQSGNLAQNVGISRSIQESRNLAEEQFDAESRVPFSPAICISWEEFYMGYSSKNMNAWSLELACGSLKGEATYVPNLFPIKAYRNDHERVKEDRSIINFLVSCPAPWVRFLKDDNKDAGDQEDDLAALMWEKQQMSLWAEWLGSDVLEGGLISRPFCLANFKSFQGDRKCGLSASRIMTGGLAIGKLECSLVPLLVRHVMTLAKQFSILSSFGEIPNQFTSYSIKTNNDKESGCIEIGGFDYCMLYYAERIRKLISTVALNKMLYVSAAIESPRFRLSEFVLKSVNDDISGEILDRRVSYEDSGFANSEPSLVLYFGLLKTVLWPYQFSREMLRATGPETQQQSQLQDDEAKVWLEEPPSLGIAEGLSSNSHTRDEAGKNIFLSVKDAALLLDFNSDEAGTVALVGPLTVVVRSSICRNQLHSLSRARNAVSVAVTFVVSAVTVHSYVSEILPMFQILKSHLLEFKHNPFSSDKGGSLETSSDDMNGKLIEPLHATLDNFLPTDGSSNGFINFALKFQIRFESIQFCLGKQQNVKFQEDKVGGLMVPRTVLQDLDRAICISLQCFMLDFLWGDGHQLSTSVELRQLRCCVLDYEKQHLREEENDSLFGLYEICKGVSRDFHVGILDPEARKVDTRRIPSEFLIEGCSFYFEGPYLNLEEDGSSVISPFNSAKKLVPSKVPCWLPACSSRGSIEEKHNEAIGMASCNSRIDADKQAMNYCVAAEIRVDKVLLANDIVQIPFYKEASTAFSHGSLIMQAGIVQDFKGIAIELKGGSIVIDARAALLLVRTIESHSQLLSIIMNNLYENEKMSLWNSNGHGESMQAVSVSKLPALRTISLPQGHAYSPNIRHHRSYSAPTKVPWHQEGSGMSFPWLRGHSYMNMSGFTLILAQSDAVSGETLLLQMDGMGTLDADANSASVDIIHFSICTLRGDDLRHLPSIKGYTDLGYLSKFGPSTSEVEIYSGRDSNTSSKRRSLPFRSNSSSSVSMVDKQVLSGEEIAMFSEADVSDEKRSIDLRNESILQDLKVSCTVMSTSADTGIIMGEWKGSYYGTCLVTGLEIAITTSEIKLLVAILASLTALVDHFQDSTTKASPKPEGTCSQSTFTNQIEIPDGAVVTLKDEREHCYLAVEEEHASYRLSGVLHYSLAGERALFQVKYQDPECRDPNKSSFILLSVSAKNAEGEPFCVYYSPGSGLAVIGCASDKSRELWHVRPYKHSAKHEADEFGASENSIGNAVHLVNQKSNYALKFVNSVPMLVKQPGNPFKIRVLHLSHTANPLCNSFSVCRPSDIPQVKLSVGKVVFTLLHATGGKLHLLPLFRGRMEDTNAVLQFGARKIRFIGGTKFAFDYFEAQANMWISFVHPIDCGYFYRCQRNVDIRLQDPKKKTRVFFLSFKKVEVIINESSLDTCVFSLSALDAIGSYNLKHSPVLANYCHVENQTCAVLVCNFSSDHESKGGRILAWQTDSFLIRHMISRRELNSALLSSSVDLHLETPYGISSPVQVSLLQSAVVAVQTCFITENGSKRSAGPTIVIETSEKSQDGIRVTVSPLVQIYNASGIPLELRFYEPIHGEADGAILVLEDGNVIDDSMGSYDAIKGELRKALAFFNLGNQLLSIRPISARPLNSQLQEYLEKSEHYMFEWSEDIRRAKPVHASGIFEKIHYGLMKTLKQRKMERFFGIIHCSVRSNETEETSRLSGQLEPHFLIRTTQRKVPLIRQMVLERNQELWNPNAAWHQQYELMIFPTIRVFNFLLSRISIIFITSGKNNYREKIGKTSKELFIDQEGQQYMYVDLTDMSFIVEHHDLKLLSKPLYVGDWVGTSKQSTKRTSSGRIKELDLELDFEDKLHCARLKVFHGEDGVIQVLIYSQYALQNENDLPFFCCIPKEAKRRRKMNIQPEDLQKVSEFGQLLPCKSKICWLKRSNKIVFQRQDTESSFAELDLESFSGYTELNLSVCHADGLIDQLKLGVSLKLPSARELNPTRVICVVPRYVIMNNSMHALAVCQDGFQGDANFVVTLNSGEHAALYPRLLSAPRRNSLRNAFRNSGNSGSETSLFVRFQLKENGCDWSGPVCAEALGSFFLRLKCSSSMVGDVPEPEKKFSYAAIRVEEDASSLVMHFSMQQGEAAPYRLENRLQSRAVLFHQKDTMETEVLEPGKSVWYAWDNLCLPHKLIVRIAGTQLCREISLDKVRPWKSFRAVRSNPLSGFQLPFQRRTEILGQYSSNENGSEIEKINVGFEILANGPQRVLCVCEYNDSRKEKLWQSYFSFPLAKMDCKIQLLSFTLAESGIQKNEAQDDHLVDGSASDVPIVCMQISDLISEFIISEKYTLFQLRIQTLNVDEKWHGAPFAAMLRVHNPDRFNKEDAVLQMAAVISNHAENPNQLKYASILLQAVDLNMDEDTLMKLVPFYRHSLTESESHSRQMYFHRFEIHPIKIIVSFLPGQSRTDYTSTQETLRSLLHTVIKVPSIRGTTVELNGILLSHALLTFRQLAMKCVQHYSWYAMRALYIAKGSKLLPPAFASLFDDSAASSLDVFFDPSNGLIDVQGLAIGMYTFLSKSLLKRGYGGSSRYIGDLENAMKTASSNILFAVLTEVSDNMLKGAEASGFDGMITGFRRGVLAVAMEPSLIRTAVAKGGSSRRIKLNRSTGVNEMYIEGYLQAMLDTLFKQDYLRVKVVDDEVFLRNLPPNSALLDEIVGCVKDFLVGEGLLAGETSAASFRSLRRLQGETERQIGPAAIALFRQLFVIFAIRALRNQTRSWFNLDKLANKDRKGLNITNNYDVSTHGSSKADVQGTASNGKGKRNIKGTVLNFFISSAVAYIDGRLCRHIPNALARQIISGFLLSFVE